jgi:hypothetical protein
MPAYFWGSTLAPAAHGSRSAGWRDRAAGPPPPSGAAPPATSPTERLQPAEAARLVVVVFPLVWAQGLQGLAELLLPLQRLFPALLQHPARLPHRCRRHHQATGLQVAQPFLMGLELGVGFRRAAGHGSGVSRGCRLGTASVQAGAGVQGVVQDPPAADR